MSYNQYQQMHYQALYGGKKLTSFSDSSNSKVLEWKLLYNDQETSIKGPYAVCKAGENRLRATGQYNLGAFKIKTNKP